MPGSSIRPVLLSVLLSAAACLPVHAAILEVQLAGRVTGHTGNATLSLIAAFPINESASISIEFDDSVANVFPPATADFGQGGYPAASDITFNVSGELFTLTGADAATVYLGAAFGTSARYGFGATPNSGTASGSGLGFTFIALGVDLLVGHNALDLTPITSEYVEIIQEIVGNGGSPIDGSFRLDFVNTLGGGSAGGVTFEITQFVSSNVPEPATFAMVGLGVGLLALRRRGVTSR